MPLPPSTSKLMPVTKVESSLARYRAAFATSIVSVNLLIGTLAASFSRFAGVSGMPEKASNRPVADNRGQIALTRIWFGPYSEARAFEAYTIYAEVKKCYQYSRRHTHRNNSTFAGAVPNKTAAGPKRPNASYVDDRSRASLFDHVRNHCSDQMEN